MIIYALVLLILLLLELAYFRLAKGLGIVDRPNQRSSHTRATLRGGGIIFVVAILLFEAWRGFPHPYFSAGTLLIAAVSFLDDIFTLPSPLRLLIQFTGTTLLCTDTTVFGQPFFWILTAIVSCVAIINVFNFMDGVNGITGFYGLVTLGTLGYLNHQVAFVDSGLIIIVSLSVLVFGFFNFRRKAICFAGDVGSVSLALVIVFLLLRLILFTGSYYFVLLLTLYGVDAGITIFQRLVKRENILEAHRSHLYQWLVKPGPLSHLQVAGVYAALQLVINLIVVLTWREGTTQQLWAAGLILGGTCLVYLVVKFSLQRRYRLA